jgi:ribosomal 30S subunit maturation factor RimM
VPTEWLEIGRIVAPQGVRGEVRVYPDSDFPERFLTPGERWLRRGPTLAPEAVTLVSGRFLSGKNLYVLRLAASLPVSRRKRYEMPCCWYRWAIASPSYRRMQPLSVP